MTARKLQGEIDRVLKRIQEGIVEFDETWEKVKEASTPNLKEKYEGDLKKEIKKLQRFRDQVKTWVKNKKLYAVVVVLGHFTSDTAVTSSEVKNKPIADTAVCGHFRSDTVVLGHFSSDTAVTSSEVKNKPMADTAATSSEVKNKKPLLDARKAIETEMERFKVLERETKTKAYSKEGLSLSMKQKKDPTKDPNYPYYQWMEETREQMEEERSGVEEQVEALRSSSKSSKKHQGEIDALTTRIERFTWHLDKLEEIENTLRNAEVSRARMDEIKDDVNYYLQSSSDPDYYFDQAMYDVDDEDNPQSESYVSRDDDEDQTEDVDVDVPDVIKRRKKQDKDSPASPGSDSGKKEGKEKKDSEATTPPAVKKEPSTKVKKAQSAEKVAEKAAERLAKEKAELVEKEKKERKNSKKKAQDKAAAERAASEKAATEKKEKERSSVGSASSALAEASALQNQGSPGAPLEQFPTIKTALRQGNISTSPALVGSSGGPPTPVATSPVPTPVQPLKRTAPRESLASMLAKQEEMRNKRPPSPGAAASPVARPTQQSPPQQQPPQQPQQPPQQQPQPPQQPPQQPPPTQQPPPPQQQQQQGSPQEPPQPVIVRQATPQPVQAQQPPPQQPPQQPPQPQPQQPQQQQPQQQPPSQQAPQPSTAVVQQPPPSGAVAPANVPNTGAPMPVVQPGSIAQASAAATAALSRRTMQEGGATEDADEEELSYTLKLIMPSRQHLPLPSDTARQTQYVPRNPYHTPPSFPTTVAPVFDDPLIFERFSTDTLFFIFYFQQGTQHQYLAARELKKQSWRYHKDFLTWFQRHDDPQLTTEEYEKGTYLFFDYKQSWQHAIKADFTFHYRHLEDELINNLEP
eukprot:g55327.t1